MATEIRDHLKAIAT